MDLLSIGVALVLVLGGALALYWPMSLKVKILNMEIDRLKKLSGATRELLETEREIDAARGLDPDSELGVLLDGDDLPGAEAP